MFLYTYLVLICLVYRFDHCVYKYTEESINYSVLPFCKNIFLWLILFCSCLFIDAFYDSDTSIELLRNLEYFGFS